MKICKTSDYSQFIPASTNRPIDTTCLKYRLLVASMERYGFLPAYPILVQMVFGRKQIVAGQHRLEAAKQLGIPVLYVIVESTVPLDIPKIEGTQRLWSVSDYICSFINQGLQDYHFLRQYAEKKNLQYPSAAALLAGECGTSNVRKLLMSGAFKVKDIGFADTVSGIVCAASEFFKGARQTAFITAVSRFCRVKEFDCDRMIAKIKGRAFLLETQPDVARYSKMLEQVYNYGSRDRVPLAFLADAEMKARNACKERAAA